MDANGRLSGRSSPGTSEQLFDHKQPKRSSLKTQHGAPCAPYRVLKCKYNFKMLHVKYDAIFLDHFKPTRIIYD